MKRNLLLHLTVGLLTLQGSFRSYGQGRINLDTYNSAPYPQITYAQYGAYTGPMGAPVSQSYTVGFYWAFGDVRSLIPAYTPGTPFLHPVSQLYSGFNLATGVGATTTMNPGGVMPGWFTSVSDYVFVGVASGPVTMIITLYSGFNFDSSVARWVSAPFVITPAQGLATAPGVGSAMPAFGIYPLPEPSVFSLLALGFGGLWLHRRRK
jgi:hypothetical protein